MKSFKLFLLSAAVGASLPSGATLYMDHEPDSIPVISVSVVIPVGFQAFEKSDSGVFNLLPELFDQGSAALSRSEFYKEMARYGASTNFEVSNEFSTFTLDFPYLADKDYHPLFEILAQQFKEPRFNADTLKLAKLKLKAGLQGSLDNDVGLVRATGTRLRAIRDFKSFPVLLDGVDSITLEKVRDNYNREYHAHMDGWAGVVAPEAALPLIEAALQKIFPNLGGIKKGILQENLDFKTRKKFDFKPYKVALIINRNDRQQAVTSFSWLRQGTPKGFDQAISNGFGNYVLTGSGLSSYFGEEIRTKRGLAYAVEGIDDIYLGNSIVGVFANPQRARAKEAIEVISEAIKNGFEDAGVFSLMSKEDWKTQFHSYQYDWILSERTPTGRLERRMLLVEGALEPKMALTSPESWSVSQPETAQYFKDHYAGSSRLFIIVGDEKEIRPTIEKAFPSYKVLSVPYKDLLQTSTVDRLAKELN